MSVIRLLSQTPNPNIEQAKLIISRFSLRPLTLHSDNSPNTLPYLDSLNKIILEHGVAESADPLIPPPPPDPSEPNILDPSRNPVRQNFVKKIKVCLPSTRKRLRALRASLNDPISDSPPEMGAIIKIFWGGLWEEETLKPGSKRDKLAQKLLKKFHKRIDLTLIQKPTIETVTKVILNSGDSSSGPEGIPFSAYRALVDIVAPNLLSLSLYLILSLYRSLSAKHLSLQTPLVLITREDLVLFGYPSTRFAHSFLPSFLMGKE